MADSPKQEFSKAFPDIKTLKVVVDEIDSGEVKQSYRYRLDNAP